MVQWYHSAGSHIISVTCNYMCVQLCWNVVCRSADILVKAAWRLAPRKRVLKELCGGSILKETCFSQILSVARSGSADVVLLLSDQGQMVAWWVTMDAEDRNGGGPIWWQQTDEGHAQQRNWWLIGLQWTDGLEISLDRLSFDSDLSHKVFKNKRLESSWMCNTFGR